MEPVIIRDIPTREEADDLAEITRLEKPDWAVEVIAQPDGKFTVKATPP